MDGRKGAAAQDGDADTPLASLLRALRTSLEVKLSSDGSDDAGRELSLNSRARHAIYRPEGDAGAAGTSSTNTLLASIAAGDPAVQGSIQRQIRGSTRCVRLDALRRRRRELQTLRIAREAERDQQKRLIERECGKVGVEIERQRAAFEHYVQQQDRAATQRLQVRCRNRRRTPASVAQFM